MFTNMLISSLRFV